MNVSITIYLPCFRLSRRRNGYPHILPPSPTHATNAQPVDGVNYLFIKKGGLYFVCTTKVRFFFSLDPTGAVPASFHLLLVRARRCWQQ